MNMYSFNNATHFIVRVGDGINFRNSINPFWGMKKNALGIAKNMKAGDIIWFIVNKSNGGKAIGVAEFTGELYNRKEENILAINTLTNEEQGWVGDEAWDIQIHYKNLYMIDHVNIKICLQGAWIIMYYSSMKDKIIDDLPICFESIKRFTVPYTHIVKK
jgi:hypothetical protein